MNIKMLACAICLGAIAFQSCENNALPEPVPITEDCPAVISYQDQIRPILSSLQAKKDNVKDRINRPPGTPGHMPATGALTADEIELLTCWVNQGALNN
jgi:hypothetical protein